MQDPVSPPEKPDYALTEAGLRVNDGCLMKLDLHENTIASIPLASIESMRCRRTISFLTLLVAAFLFFLARLVFVSTEALFLRWIVAPCFALIGFAVFIGALIENELVVKTKDGVVRFNLPGDVRDARAFAVSVMNLKRTPSQ